MSDDETRAVSEAEARLSEALTQARAEVAALREQQTGMADVLRIISRSPTDLQPVLDAVAKSAARLCSADDAVIFRMAGDGLAPVAHVGPIPGDDSRIA